MQKFPLHETKPCGPHRSLFQYAVFPQDFPKFPQNVPKTLSKCPNTKSYLRIPIYQNQIISLHLTGSFNSFNFIYWTPICGKYFFKGSVLEKCGKTRKNGRFSRRLQPIGEIPHRRKDFK